MYPKCSSFDQTPIHIGLAYACTCLDTKSVAVEVRGHYHLKVV